MNNVNDEDAATNPSEKRRQSARQQLRAQILRAGAEILAEEGYEGLTMRKLGQRIEYSATAAYMFFKDKDELILEILHSAYREFGVRLQQASMKTVEGDALDRLAAIGQAYIDFGLENPQEYQLMFMRRSERLWELLATNPDDGFDSQQVLVEAVQAAQQVGALPPGPAQLYSYSLWSVVHGLTAMGIIAPNIPVEVFAVLREQTLATYLAGLRSSTRNG